MKPPKNQALVELIYVTIRTAPAEMLAEISNPHSPEGDDATMKLSRHITSTIETQFITQKIDG